jgi:hypothetical protein
MRAVRSRAGNLCVHGRETIYIDSRHGLTDALRYQYEILEDFLYLRRSIGRFVSYDALIRRADGQISDWTKTAPEFG